MDYSRQGSQFNKRRSFHCVVQCEVTFLIDRETNRWIFLRGERQKVLCNHLQNDRRNGKAEIIQTKMVLCVKHGCTSELRSIWLLKQEGFGHRMFSDCMGFLPSTVLPLMTLRFLGYEVAEMGSKLVAMATEKCQ